MPEPDVPHTSPWVFRLLPAATFVVGLALGGVLTWVGSDTGPLPSDDASAPTPTPTSQSSTPDASSSPASACLDAADAVEDAVGLIRRGAAATRDFQPKELVDILNQLETLDPQLRALAARCSGAET